MKKHALCLTLDTDPDGLNAPTPDRHSMQWDGLENLVDLTDQFAESPKLGSIPITWFVRADGQLENILGSATYLLENYADFWAGVQKQGHEIGWHPHLYRQRKSADAPIIITDPIEAADELDRLWENIRSVFHASSFRNGEGWHIPETFAAVERLGFRCDSTAIPGRKGGAAHPMDWENAPNQPYFPHTNRLCESSTERPLLELPMNSWLVLAPYDSAPRIRYINPAVHPRLFENALVNWEQVCRSSEPDFLVWVLIFHPEEVFPDRGADALYSRSVPELCRNLISMTECLHRLGHDFEWMTVSDAAELWRAYHRKVAA